MERTTSVGLVLITASSRFFQETKNLKNRGVSKNNRCRTPSVIEVYLGRFSEFFEGCLALCLRVSPRSDFSGNGSYISKPSQWEFFKKNHTGTYVRDPPVINFPFLIRSPTHRVLDTWRGPLLENRWTSVSFHFRQLLGRLFGFFENHGHTSLRTAGHSFPIPDHIPTNRFSSDMVGGP